MICQLHISFCLKRSLFSLLLFLYVSTPIVFDPESPSAAVDAAVDAAIIRRTDAITRAVFTLSVPTHIDQRNLLEAKPGDSIGNFKCRCGLIRICRQPFPFVLTFLLSLLGWSTFSFQTSDSELGGESPAASIDVRKHLWLKDAF